MQAICVAWDRFNLQADTVRDAIKSCHALSVLGANTLVIAAVIVKSLHDKPDQSGFNRGKYF